MCQWVNQCHYYGNYISDRTGFNPFSEKRYSIEQLYSKSWFYSWLKKRGLFWGSFSFFTSNKIIENFFPFNIAEINDVEKSKAFIYSCDYMGKHFHLSFNYTRISITTRKLARKDMVWQMGPHWNVCNIGMSILLGCSQKIF